MLSTHITYEVTRARIGDLRLQADERRRARPEPQNPDRPPRSEHRPHRSGQPLRAFGALRLRRA